MTWRALLFVGVVGLALTSCSPRPVDEVVVLSPHWDGIKTETARAFSAWHARKYGAPVTIRWREVGGGTSKMLAFLNAEYKTSPSSGIDVLYGGGLDPYLELEKNHLLTPYDPPGDVLAEIPPALNGIPLYDPAHEWFAAALSGFGIITNERARQAAGLPQVHTWDGLADPRLIGWVSASDPRASGSALAIYEIILQADGWDKGWAELTEISGNVRSFITSAAASAVEVSTGDAAYGMAIDSYGQSQSGFYGRDNVSFVLPEGATVITPDSIAILKNPPHPELARHFLEFVLSREGQQLWMLPRGANGGSKRYAINRMCVVPTLYTELAASTPIQTNPFEMHFSFTYDNKLGSSRRTILSQLIAAWLIDTHDELVPVWRALNSPAAQKLPQEKRDALLRQLTAPPCTLDELLHFAATDWKDPVKRTGLINSWQAAALDRYKSVLAQIPAN